MVSRRWLIARALSVLGLGLVLSCRSKRTQGRERVLRMALAQLKPGINTFPLERLLLIREGNSIGCVSLTCTHQVCALKINPNGGFACPCHGSEFNAQGQVLNGPATKALPWYKLSLEADGFISVDLKTQVDPLWRLQV